MARIETTHLVDDLDGGDADETVDWALDGKRYEADLSTANADKLRDLLAPYVAVARRASSGTRPATASRRSSSAADRAENQRIREWATKRGMKIAERGRIPADVLAAYYDEGAGSGPRAVAS